ncbi:MAG: NAD(+) synthase [Lachnospiraceae bacterium]|nr:NAD(+) synthase [Lachnospiraceae bacterium]
MHDGFLKVAAVTPKVRVADVAYNVEHICRRIDEASDLGAKVIVFPELCITGYSCGDLLYQKTLLTAAEEGLVAVMRFTAGHGSDAIVFVGLPMEMDGKLYNVAAAVQNGKVLALVPKQNLPDYDGCSESRYFTRGNAAPVPVMVGGEVVPFGTRSLIDASDSIEGLVIGCEICEDAWVTKPPHVELAGVGVTLMVNLAASGEAAGKAPYRRMMVQSTSARLIAGYVYASAGEGESTAEEVYSGHRMICENGQMLAEGSLFTSGITVSEIDIASLLSARRRKNTYSCLSCADDTYHRAIVSFEVGETELTRSIAPLPFVPADRNALAEQCEQALTMQALGLKKRLEHVNGKTVYLGVSGGLDSTLAMLAVCRAFDLSGLPRDGIIGVTMPCYGTTDRTYGNACALVKALGATLKEVPIADAVDVHFRDIGQDKNNHDVTYENAQARERTQVLMDLANQTGGLVIGTGDLSELALGWCTYNGDQTSMYGVNGGIPKTLIRRMVAHAAERADTELKRVLSDILDTPVSPELVPPKDGEISQKTEHIVGPYELHDFFLYYTLRHGFTPAKIYRLAKIAFSGACGAGSGLCGECTPDMPVYDAAEIRKWMIVFYKRFFTQQFKRANLPDGVKIGNVSLSPRTGFRIVSDAVARLWIEEAEGL